jgi:dihydroorotate dehydrogenase electron transfer subunit
MYKKDIYKIRNNEPLTSSVWRMVLEGDTQWISRPGQFVNIELAGRYLRRPISISDYDADTITLIYKVVGGGTEQMSRMAAGEELDLLVGLGNGFDVEASGEKPLLVGGGVGVPPLYNLCKVLLKQGKRPTVILGFNKADEIFSREAFAALGATVYVATADGSVGVKGFVTDVLREKGVEYDYFYSCGPLPMLKALSEATTTSGELSFEERMGCGFGACMGCSCKTLTGNKRICKEGPVMKKEELLW